MQVAAIFILLLGFLGPAQSHDWGWGRCPTVDPVSNFSVDKFLGHWYVIEKFHTSSTCLEVRYTRVSSNKLEVAKGRGLYFYIETLNIPDLDNGGKMRALWPFDLAEKGDYVVFDTDYDDYAAIYECQTLSRYFHRKSASILSRNTSLDKSFIDRVKRRLKHFGIDTHDFDPVSHYGCF